MFKNIVVAALLCLTMNLLVQCPAEAKYEKLKTVGRVARKIVVLPFYILIGAGSGVLIWWHLGGSEAEVH